MPAISIIIPVFRVEKYLRKCLDSVLNQTFTDWEAICINDGSPDNCPQILAEYAARDKRFVVLNQENAGQADARNNGIKRARGEYIMCLDSDDFIHPQAMELAHHMAVRDNSDMVCFTYDRMYRPHLMVRHILGMNTDNVVPRRIHKRYDVNRVKTLVTDNIYKYATERAHNCGRANKKWLVKHCQPWKNLYRRELIADIPFIRGIIFEDFPWWSAILLKCPRTTIMPLPLYFYMPNFGGTVLSEKRLRIMENICTGMKSIFKEYQSRANEYQMCMWSNEFKWYFVRLAFAKKKYLKTQSEIDAARKCMTELYDAGVLSDVPPMKWAQKLRREIMHFIGK